MTKGSRKRQKDVRAKEWAKHLRPQGKRAASGLARQAAKQQIRKEQAESEQE
jgi:hypothetical protein